MESPFRIDEKRMQHYRWFIGERIRIGEKRRNGNTKGLTRDKILQEYHFCNIYREWDAVTGWFRNNVRLPCGQSNHLAWETTLFRYFNEPRTGAALIRAGLLGQGKWDRDLAEIALRLMDPPWFRAAYRQPIARDMKGDTVTRAIEYVNRLHGRWGDADREVRNSYTLHGAWQALRRAGVGDFLAYEVVSDLRHTPYLDGAEDVSEWALPGPGAKRGLVWLAGYEPGRGEVKMATPLAIDGMRAALKTLRHNWPEAFPLLELREVEHSLCEWDKYKRVETHTGRPRRKYTRKPTVRKRRRVTMEGKGLGRQRREQ